MCQGRRLIRKGVCFEVPRPLIAHMSSSTALASLPFSYILIFISFVFSIIAFSRVVERLCTSEQQSERPPSCALGLSMYASAYLTCRVNKLTVKGQVTSVCAQSFHPWLGLFPSHAPHIFNIRRLRRSLLALPQSDLLYRLVKVQITEA